MFRGQTRQGRASHPHREYVRGRVRHPCTGAPWYNRVSQAHSRRPGTTRARCVYRHGPSPWSSGARHGRRAGSNPATGSHSGDDAAQGPSLNRKRCATPCSCGCTPRYTSIALSGLSPALTRTQGAVALASQCNASRLARTCRILSTNARQNMACGAKGAAPPAPGALVGSCMRGVREVTFPPPGVIREMMRPKPLPQTASGAQRHVPAGVPPLHQHRAFWIVSRADAHTGRGGIGEPVQRVKTGPHLPDIVHKCPPEHGLRRERRSPARTGGSSYGS